MLLVFLPCIDMARVIVERVVNNESPLRPDQNHLQHLLQKKFNAQYVFIPYLILAITPYFLNVIFFTTYTSIGIAIATYFIVGSAVTYIGISKKEKAGIAEKRSGVRGPENVWGSGLTALICAVGTLSSNPFYTKLFILGYVASISTKLSDTVASELGKVYGKNTFLITTLKPVSPGTEGAISFEGTVAGLSLIHI